MCRIFIVLTTFMFLEVHVARFSADSQYTHTALKQSNVSSNHAIDLWTFILANNRFHP